MMNESSLLLLFETDRPCWSGSLAELAGEDPAGLDILAGRHLLEQPLPGAYVLTPSGRERFVELARESFLDTAPGEPPEDPGHSLLCLETMLRLDRGFHSPWGSKEARSRVCLSYFPGLPAPQDFAGLKTLQGHPLAESFAREFPRVGRDDPHPSPGQLDAWLAKTGAPAGKLDLDVLFIHRYDYTYYMDASVPRDSLKLLNTDRLLIRLAEPARTSEGDFRRKLVLDLAGLRPFLEYGRRFLLPGLFDTDTQEQSSVTWWVWVTRTSGEASLLREQLAPFAGELIGPSAPLDFWILSLEALETEPQRHETFYELFECAAIPVARTA